MVTRGKVPTAFLMAGLLAGCAGTGHQLPEISESEKAAAIAEIERAAPLQPTARTAAANESIARNVMRRLQPEAQKLCKELERKGCWYTLEFSPKGEMNAFVHKNQIVLFNGLAQYLENGDEFAAILGHEMGHHIAGHYEEDIQNRAVGALIGGLIFAGIAGASGAYQNSPYAAQSDMDLAMRIGAAIGDISFSKEQEREADYLSAYLTARAGYNPEKGSNVWVKLAKTSERRETKLLDSHPAGPDRLAAWRKSVREVRYSADFLPNPVGTEKEAERQVARVFADPAKGIYPESSIMASLPPPSWELQARSGKNTGTDAVTGIQAVAVPPSSGRSTGALAPLRDWKPQALPNKAQPETARGASGIQTAAQGPQDAGVITAKGAWEGSGNSETCGADWSLRLEQTAFELGGRLTWNGQAYDILGELDFEGRSETVRATPSVSTSNTSGPKHFKLEIELYLDAVLGHMRLEGRDRNCSARFRIARKQRMLCRAEASRGLTEPLGRTDAGLMVGPP